MNQDNVTILVREGFNPAELAAAIGLTMPQAHHLYASTWRKIKRQDFGRIARYTDRKRDYDRAYQQRKRDERLAGSQSGVR